MTTRLLFAPLLCLFGFVSCGGDESESSGSTATATGGNTGAGATGGQSDGGSSTGGDSTGGTGPSGTGGTSPNPGGPPYGHPDPAQVYPEYEGFTLWVVEEFEEPIDLDNDPIWTWSDGGFENHRFSRDALAFEDGKLKITLSNTPAPESCSVSNTGVEPAREQTSGEFRSRHNWFRYGRYETALKAPEVQPGDPAINGNYIASLFTFRHPGCRFWREIDIELTGDAPNALGTNLIWAEPGCGTTDTFETVEPEGLNFRTGFHTVGFEWLPGKVTYYYLDEAGQQVTVRVLENPNVPTLSTKLMANLWMLEINSSYPFGGPEGANNILPLTSEYEFIRFYKWDGDDTYPCPGMDESCLSADDLLLTGNNGCDGIDMSHEGELLDLCPNCGVTVRQICEPVVTCNQ